MKVQVDEATKARQTLPWTTRRRRPSERSKAGRSAGSSGGGGTGIVMEGFGQRLKL